MSGVECVFTVFEPQKQSFIALRTVRAAGITARWGSFGMAFYIPGVREFSLWAGCIDASKPVLMKNMNKYHENVMLLPGGQ